MTEKPLYRRVYGNGNPLMQQQYWRPPSNEYAVQYNRNPNAAQDLRNLFGTFFTPNAAPQYQQYQQYQPYQTATPTNYTAYQPNTFRDDSPQAAQNAQEVRDAVYDFAKNQVLTSALVLATGGGLGYGLGSVARPYVPYALMRLGATKYGAPIANGINKFANSPVGKVFGKVADFIW